MIPRPATKLGIPMHVGNGEFLVVIMEHPNPFPPLSSPLSLLPNFPPTVLPPIRSKILDFGFVHYPDITEE